MNAGSDRRFIYTIPVLYCFALYKTVPSCVNQIIPEKQEIFHLWCERREFWCERHKRERHSQNRIGSQKKWAMPMWDQANTDRQMIIFFAGRFTA